MNRFFIGYKSTKNYNTVNLFARDLDKLFAITYLKNIVMANNYIYNLP